MSEKYKTACLKDFFTFLAFWKTDAARAIMPNSTLVIFIEREEEKKREKKRERKREREREREEKEKRKRKRKRKR